MTPPHDVAPPSLEELRAAVLAFADRPGPARFHRVATLLERAKRAAEDDHADHLPL